MMLGKRKIAKGLRRPRWGAKRVKQKSQQRLVRRLARDNDGVDVMAADWDNLIILDACRYDSFEKLNTISGQLRKTISRGENTPRFIEENFADRKFNDTVYVCGNAAVGDVINYVDVHKFLGLWTDQDLPDFDRTYRDIVPPELVVEKTLEKHEEYPNKRLISHFLQPHPPFVIRDGNHISPGSKYRDYTAAREGKLSAEVVRSVYEDNVAYVLDFVEELVDSLPGKTVVTADHGEILGEGVGLLYEVIHPRWSFRNRRRFDYAHYDYIRQSELVEVPWLVVESDERREITTSSESAGIEMNDEIVEDRLEALGYR